MGLLAGGAEMVARTLTRLGLIERRYGVDFQIVCYVACDYTRAQAILPRGMRPYRDARGDALAYVTLMRLTTSPVVAPEVPAGLAFDEMLWGVRIQPVSPKPYLSMSLVASRLVTSDLRANDFLDEDGYTVARDALMHMTVDTSKPALSVSCAIDGRTVGTIDLGATPVVDQRFAFLPATTEVFKPRKTQGGPVLRYEFFGLGFLQILAGHDLGPGLSFDFEHPFFEVGGFNPLATRPPDLQPRVVEVYLSRPDTPGLQLLTHSRPH